MLFEKEKIRAFCTISNIFAAVYIILVFTILLVPSLGVKTKKNLTVDNRAAAQFPEISCKNYKNFAPQFEKWLADRFRKRKQCIRAWNYIVFHCFRESPSEQVVLGKDGLIFLASHLAGKENKNSLFKVILNLDPQTIRMNVKGLLALQDVFRKARMQILFVTVPTKHTLNYDKVPQKLRKEFCNNQAGIPICTKITEELKKADPAYAEKYFLDLYPAAFAANEKMQLIPPKNFHWIPGPYTQLAAHRIAEKFAVTRGEFLLKQENYRLHNTDSDLDFFFGFELDNPSWTPVGECGQGRRILFTDQYALQNCSTVISSTICYWENPAANGGKILAIGDSFTPTIGQDLSRHFSRVAAVDFAAIQRNFPQQAKYVLKEIIKNYQPSYLVVMSHFGYIFTEIVADMIQDPSLHLRKQHFKE